MRAAAVLSFALTLLAPAAAEAGRRWCQSGCYVRPYYYQPYYYQPYAQRGVAEVLGEVASRKAAYDALVTGLGTIFPGGFSDGFAGGGYGAGQVTTTYGPQGATSYAYQTSAGGFGALDVAAAFDKADRYAQNALQLAGQAGTDLNAIVQTAADGQVRVAEVLARGQAASAALAAAAGQQPQPLQRTFAFQLHQDQQGNWKVDPAPAGGLTDPRQAFLQVAQQSANARCLKCHSAGSANGQLDLSNLAALPPEEWHKKGGILDRLTTTDETKRMPRGADGKAAGEPIGSSEYRWWLGAAPDENK